MVAAALGAGEQHEPTLQRLQLLKTAVTLSEPSALQIA